MTKQKISKGLLLGVIQVLVLAAFILASQNWYQVSMSATEVAIKKFDGYSAYQWITPLLFVAMVSLLVAAISAPRIRLLSLILGLIASATLLGFTIKSVLEQDLSNLAKQLETATGIAATHGIEGLTVVTQIAAYLQLGVLILLVAAFGYALVAQRQFSGGRARGVDQSAAKENSTLKDPISLWDEQR